MRHAPATHVLFLHVTQVCVWCVRARVCVCVCMCVCVQRATRWATARARRATQAPTERRVRAAAPEHTRQHRARQRAVRVSAVRILFL